MEDRLEPVVTTAEKSNTGTVIAVIIVLAIIAGGIWYFMNGIAVSASSNSGSKSGTYSASTTYISPAGSEPIDVKLTVKENVVTDVTTTVSTSDRQSSEYVSRFNSGYKQQVVGKSLNSISLTVVNGASLTTQGFMSALQKIKTQAV